MVGGYIQCPYERPHTYVVIVSSLRAIVAGRHAVFLWFVASIAIRFSIVNMVHHLDGSEKR